MLIVGGGAVGLEKVAAIFKNSDNAHVVLVAPEIKKEIEEIASQYSNLKLIRKAYHPDDLQDKDIVIAATSIPELNSKIQQDARERKILVNVADTPDLCDFYLSSVVKKGELKIAISTNGQSPTFAKRIREMLEDVLPDGMDEVLNNLRGIREQLKGDFEYKVQKLNEITSIFKQRGDKK